MTDLARGRKSYSSFIIKWDPVCIQPVGDTQFGKRTHINAIITAILCRVLTSCINSYLGSIALFVRRNRGSKALLPITVIIDFQSPPNTQVSTRGCSIRRSIPFLVNILPHKFRKIKSAYKFLYSMPLPQNNNLYYRHTTTNKTQVTNNALGTVGWQYPGRNYWISTI